MKRTVALAAIVLCAFTATALEWGFKESGECRCVVPDEPALRFPDGFKATVRVACDLDKVDARSNHANILCKGNDFHDGYCVMIRKDGHLLVDIKGVEPQYNVCQMHL